MGMDERHEGQKAVVGDAENADLAVGFGNVVDQPVDGVVGVGGFVDGGGILRPVDGAVHHVVALGAVFAADVLDDADVAALDDDVGRVVVAVENRAEVGALEVRGEFVGAVGRAREQDWRARCAFRHQDDRVQPDAVAHGDHDFAACVVEAAGGRLQFRRRLAGIVGIERAGGLLRPGNGKTGKRKGGDGNADAAHAFRTSRGMADWCICRVTNRGTRPEQNTHRGNAKIRASFRGWSESLTGRRGCCV